MLEYYDHGDIMETIAKVISKVEGSYALGIISAEYPDRLFCVRKDSPLIIGVGQGRTSSPPTSRRSSRARATSTA